MMRIAWIGPMPSNEGGAGGVSNLLLRELDFLGLEVDCYVPGDEGLLPQGLVKLEHVRFICEPSSWTWNRWYSRNRLMSFTTGQLANLRSENRLARVLLRNHLQNPYDVVYQFSHIELSSIRRFRSILPPIVLHPSVHAMGELQRLRAERSLSKRSESWIMRTGAKLLLSARSYIQKRHIQHADLVLGLSQNFMQDLSRDYIVPVDRIHVIPNPVDLEKFAKPARSCSSQDKITILFVSRISVRKGVEMIVDLSHRLNDLHGGVEILVVGDRSMWSDYTKLLSQLNTQVAQYVGSVNGATTAMQQLYQRASLLIQPSHYEPFGLTVAEALASGIPVVASDKVGAAEQVDHTACRIYLHSDIDALESEVRRLINEVRDSERAWTIRKTARAEAERLFNVQLIASKLIDSLYSVSASPERARVDVYNRSVYTKSSN